MKQMVQPSQGGDQISTPNNRHTGVVVEVTHSRTDSKAEAPWRLLDGGGHKDGGDAPKKRENRSGEPALLMYQQTFRNILSGRQGSIQAHWITIIKRRLMKSCPDQGLSVSVSGSFLNKSLKLDFFGWAFSFHIVP